MDAERQSKLKEFEEAAWDGKESTVRVVVYDDTVVVAAVQAGAILFSPNDPYIAQLPELVANMYSPSLPPLCSACDNEVPWGAASAYVVIIAGRKSKKGTPAMGGCLCKDCAALPEKARAAAINTMIYGSPCTGVFPV